MSLNPSEFIAGKFKLSVKCTQIGKFWRRPPCLLKDKCSAIAALGESDDVGRQRNGDQPLNTISRHDVLRVK